MSAKTVCPKDCACGRHSNARAWSNDEREYLLAAYALDVPIAVIAAQMGKSYGAVACMANELGAEKHRHQQRPEYRQYLGDKMRAWWTTLAPVVKKKLTSHPCSEATRKKIGDSLRASNAFQAQWTSTRRQKSSGNMAQLHVSGAIKGGYSRGKQGMRKDLGIYVRSAWEANYARYLNLLKTRGDVVNWEYEPVRFVFSDIKRGTRSYLPDFRVTYQDGRVEFHEVKGYWTPRAKTAVKRFRARYPEHVLLIIDGPQYKEIEKEAGEAVEWE